MITVYCIDKNTCRRFTKTFDSPYKARVFILRCRYGHNVKVEGFTSKSQEAERELSYMWKSGV